MSRWRIQHEFDNEPTYIFAPEQSDDDEPVITVASNSKNPANHKLAILICDFLNGDSE